MLRSTSRFQAAQKDVRTGSFSPPQTAILFAVFAQVLCRFVHSFLSFFLTKCVPLGNIANISRKGNMKKTKDVSDEDEYSADDPEEVEGASEEEWTPEAGAEGGTKKRPQREVAKKRQHSEEEEEEEEEEDEEDDDEEDEESDSDTGKKPKRKRRSKKEEDDKEDEDEEDSDDNSFNESSGETPKDYTSGAFVVAKADIGGNTDPTLWRIDGKALLQKFLPFKEDGKTLYKSTSTYSGWSVNTKDKYLAAQVTFKVQSRTETIVELHLDQQQQEVVKEEKED